MECLDCNNDISDLVNFDNVLKNIICPNCKLEMIVLYDEEYDSESGEENGFFYLEKIPKNIEEIKYVTKDDMNDFFNKQFPFKEISFNENKTIWKITFPLHYEKEIIKYWNDK